MTPDTTPVEVGCSLPECPNTFARSRADAYYSRPLPGGWVSVLPGYRCAEHHDFEISWEQAIDTVNADRLAVEQEFGNYPGSDLDHAAVIRALHRGPST